MKSRRSASDYANYLKDTEFGRNLKRVMRSRHVTHLQLAVKAELNARHLYRLSSSRARPSFDVVCRLADALEVPVTEFRDTGRVMQCPKCLHFW